MRLRRREERQRQPAELGGRQFPHGRETDAKRQTSHGVRRRSAGPADPSEIGAERTEQRERRDHEGGDAERIGPRPVADVAATTGSDRPNATQAMAAATPVPELFSQSRDRIRRVRLRRRSPSDAEYVDIDPLRKFRRIGGRLEDRKPSSDRRHRAFNSRLSASPTGW